MHPILHLAAQRPTEYHRGLAHGLGLAIEQIRRLPNEQPVITSSSLRALVRRIQAITDGIRHNAWKEADELLTHTTAPPIPRGERPNHLPVVGRAGEETLINNSQTTIPQRIPHSHHSVRRS